MKIWNHAALCKHLWNLTKQKDMLWIKWIHGYYVKGQDLTTMIIPTQASWVVRKIFEARKYMRNITDSMAVIRNDKFSIQRTYGVLRGTYQHMGWGKILTSNPAPPKCVFISWLILMGRLATWEQLSRIGILVDPMCSLCSEEEESISHLYFECRFSHEVWHEVKSWCRIDRATVPWREEAHYLENGCRSKTTKQRLYRLAFSVVVYGVWKERNLRRFQDKTNASSQVVSLCKDVILVKLSKYHKQARLVFPNM